MNNDICEEHQRFINEYGTINDAHMEGYLSYKAGGVPYSLYNPFDESVHDFDYKEILSHEEYHRWACDIAGDHWINDFFYARRESYESGYKLASKLWFDYHVGICVSKYNTLEIGSEYECQYFSNYHSPESTPLFFKVKLLYNHNNEFWVFESPKQNGINKAFIVGKGYDNIYIKGIDYE